MAFARRIPPIMPIYNSNNLSTYTKIHHCHMYSSIPQYFSSDEYEETLLQEKAFLLHQLMEP
jgi:hypothetical protein